MKFYPIVQEFKKRVANDPQGILKTWDPNDKNVCNYKGFSCAPYPADKQQTVSGVDFNGFGFAGKEGEGLTLYGFIEKLTDMTIFHANSNGFTNGPIPKSIGQAKNLQEALFDDNKLTGCLPYEIGLLAKATVFNLSANSLTDNYFTEIGPECTKLIAKKVVDPKQNCISRLPNQRPKAECDAFLSKPKSCPAQNTIPCKTVAVKWMWRNIEQLIADHSELRQGLMSLWMQAKVAVFENKLEDHLPIVDYVRYFEILKSFRNGQKSKAKMVQEIAVLFVNHSDLFDEFVPGDFLK
ncbi:hypothetical protein FH972_019052 [Carpinus fangiana]|uniref:Leucine-rich repeat-containing N-terminal plant-type domain-containing protein n=1 Tax=Carpinus fangiana TaxID=176857 RepID=A0A5N6RT59_9ROSI|nr:hypothetical protein FH972_019052 [Carpinus fangiana]